MIKARVDKFGSSLTVTFIRFLTGNVIRILLSKFSYDILLTCPMPYYPKSCCYIGPSVVTSVALEGFCNGRDSLLALFLLLFLLIIPPAPALR